MSVSRTRSRTVLTGTALAAALALAGCGGSGHSHQQTGQVTIGAPGAALASTGAGGPGKRHGRGTGKAGGSKASRRAHRVKNPPRDPTPKQTQAKGSSAAFAPTATGRPAAIRHLAATLPGAGTPVHFASGASSAANFTAGADAICGSYRTQVRGIAAEATSLTAQADELQTLVNATSVALRKFETLSPPSSAGALATKYLTLTGKSVSNFVLAQERSSSKSEAVGTAQETRDMKQANASSHEALGAQKTAKRLGFKVCGTYGAEWL